MAQHLETTRLTLRPWRESDAAALFRYARDPSVGPPRRMDRAREASRRAAR